MQIIRLFISLAVLLTSIAVHAASIMSLVPNTTNVSVSHTGTATVDYTVTNTTVSGTLAGLAVDLSAAGGNPNGLQLQSDTCTGTSLVPAASCTFQVMIVGAKQPVTFTLSPRVCANNNTVCSQATASNRPLITLGSTTRGVTAYIAESNDTVLPISDTTQALGTALTGFDFGSNPFAGTTISPDGNTLYVSNTNADSIQIIDLTGNNPAVSVTLGTGPAGIAVSPDNSKIYVANTVSGTVSIVDTQTLAVTTLPQFFVFPYAVTLSPDGGILYVNYAGFTFSVQAIDLSNNTVINTLTGLNQTSNSAPFTAVDPTNTYVVTSDPHADAIVVTDTNLNVLGPIPTGSGSQPGAIIFSPDGSRIYFYLGGTSGGEIGIFDINTISFLPSITGVGDLVYALSFNPEGTHLYVVPQLETFITVIKVDDSSTTQINIPNTPRNFGVNPFVG